MTWYNIFRMARSAIGFIRTFEVLDAEYSIAASSFLSEALKSTNRTGLNVMHVQKLIIDPYHRQLYRSSSYLAARHQ